MKDSLEVVVGRDGAYRLQWYLVEENDMGGFLGDCAAGRDDYLKTCEDDERIAFLVAEKSAEDRESSTGFRWDSKVKAASALKEIKEAWKAHTQATKGHKSLLGKYTQALTTCLMAGITEEELSLARKDASRRAGK